MKANGKQKQYDDIRKYKDAILWGSSVLNEPLPVSFHQEIESYLAGYKREVVKVKKLGNTDQTASDPISFELYRLFLRWSVEESNIFMWFWTLSQWSCMARCASIDPLSFHNFDVAQDSIKC